MVLRVFSVLEEKAGDKDDSYNQGVRDILIGSYGKYLKVIMSSMLNKTPYNCESIA